MENKNGNSELKKLRYKLSDKLNQIDRALLEKKDPVKIVIKKIIVGI